MPLPERSYGVWLHESRIGSLSQRGDHTRFTFGLPYLADVDRPVLGLEFEQNLAARRASALRLPPWFSNLLPEGRLRDWIAAERHVSAQREMELLAQVGHDLPGAVRVRPIEPDEVTANDDWGSEASEPEEDLAPAVGLPWRFSLAGVALKFSMLAEHHRLTLPATGVGGDWIVKLPDRSYAYVPLNEHAMMSLAARVGIAVPDVRLVHREEVDGLPPGVWPSNEDLAYAVRRFDRGSRRELIHIEDLAQVRNFYPDAKYEGNYETIGSLLYRGHDTPSLQEFTRRLVFSILISNADAHLKNWSLIYHDKRVPMLAPAYDLVSTRLYMGADEEFGLKFGGTKRPERLRLSTFDRLERRLGTNAGLADIGRDTITRTRDAWGEAAGLLRDAPELRDDIGHSIAERALSLLSRR